MPMLIPILYAATCFPKLPPLSVKKYFFAGGFGKNMHLQQKGTRCFLLLQGDIFMFQSVRLHHTFACLFESKSRNMTNLKETSDL